ncbi:MAG: hypothetical protein WKF75_18790 [Singulisphaera sp.]
MPTFRTHINNPLTHRSPFDPNDPTGTTDVVNLTYGVNFEFYKQSTLTFGFVNPVTSRSRSTTNGSSCSTSASAGRTPPRSSAVEGPRRGRAPPRPGRIIRTAKIEPSWAFSIETSRPFAVAGPGNNVHRAALILRVGRGLGCRPWPRRLRGPDTVSTVLPEFNDPVNSDVGNPVRLEPIAARARFDDGVVGGVEQQHTIEAVDADPLPR